jgi:hypothetical protein
VPVHVVVKEDGEKASLNNPDGEELLAKVGGRNSGLPFFAFLDAGGEMIVNSTRPAAGKSGPSNIGYPSAPEEIDWFLVMLKKAVPNMTPAESGTIEQWLRQHSK